MKYRAQPLAGQSGFTLVELVISFALLSAGILAVTLTYSYIVRLQTKEATVRGVQQSSRYILDQLARDVRSAAVITRWSSTKVSLQSSTDSGSQVVTYAWDPSFQLYRCLNTVNCTSANGVPAGSSGTSVRQVNFQLYPAAASTTTKQVLEVDMTVEQQDATQYGSIKENAYSYDVNSVITARGM